METPIGIEMSQTKSTPPKAKPRYAYDSRMRPIAVFPVRGKPQERKGWNITIAIRNKYDRIQYGTVWERFPNSGHVSTAYFDSEAEARAVMKTLGIDHYPEDIP
jgi:hypothetical protein